MTLFCSVFLPEVFGVFMGDTEADILDGAFCPPPPYLREKYITMKIREDQFPHITFMIQEAHKHKKT